MKRIKFDTTSNLKIDYETLSQSSNESENSNLFNFATGNEWKIIRVFDNGCELESFLTIKMPYSSTRTSHTNTYCNFNKGFREKHKMITQMRSCKGHHVEVDEEKATCFVEYRLNKCDSCSKYRILQKNEHIVICDDYINDNDPDSVHPDSHMTGLHDKVKEILNDLVDKRPYILPSQAHAYLNEPGVKEKGMKNWPIPTLDQVTYYFRRNRVINKLCNNNEDVETALSNHSQDVDSSVFETGKENVQKTSNYLNTRTEDWSNQDVNQWIIDNDFDYNIKSALENFDGQLLQQLYSMMKDAPEYYYSSIGQNKKVELYSVVKFSNQLKRLF